MKKLVLLFITVLLFGVSKAQTPGFLGKRYSVSVGGLFSIAALPASVNQSPSLLYGLNKTFSLDLDYVLSRKWTIGLDYQRLPTAVDLTFDNNIAAIQNSFYQINANVYELNLSRYAVRSDFIAPVGRYINLGIRIINYNLIDKQGHFFDANTKMATGSFVGYSLSLGRRRVFFKNIITDAGVIVSLLSSPSKNLNFVPNVHYRLQGATAFNFKFSIGYLF
jgi:hypothetical protein